MRSYRPYQGRRPRAGKRLWIGLLVLVLIAVIVFAGLLTAVLAGAHDELAGEPGIMLVLGCAVQADGNPSPMLQARLDRALDYWKENPNVTVVVTGGKGTDEVLSEADCMAEYLIAGGVPDGKILREDRATSTWENLLFAQELLDEYDLPKDDIMLVSSGFHLTRAKLLFGRAWEGDYILSTLAAPVGSFWDAVWMHIREPLVLAKDILFRG